MSLAKHVDAADVLRKAGDHPVHKHTVHRAPNIAYLNRYQGSDTPKYEIPEKGLNGRATYQILHDELDLYVVCLLACNGLF
jgi:glutamate decarboxylase